jgi:hypothetical protein
VIIYLVPGSVNGQLPSSRASAEARKSEALSARDEAGDPGEELAAAAEDARSAFD